MTHQSGRAGTTLSELCEPKLRVEGRAGFVAGIEHIEELEQHEGGEGQNHGRILDAAHPCGQQRCAHQDQVHDPLELGQQHVPGRAGRCDGQRVRPSLGQALSALSAVQARLWANLQCQGKGLSDFGVRCGRQFGACHDQYLA